jgi:hypothetical protein
LRIEISIESRANNSGPRPGTLHPTNVSGDAFVTRVIENGIKHPVHLLLEHRCFPAALILTYSGVEMMAFLNMPLGKLDVTRSDFIDWADKYMAPHLPESASGQRITGKDLYGARCSALRGTDSRLAREGHCQLIRYASSAAGDAITIGVEELVRAFFRATDSFFAQMLADESRAAIVADRLEQMLKTLPF